jgi:hypothetical protein
LQRFSHRDDAEVAMECRRCAACGEAFRPRSQVQEQRYCGSPACQRERRRRWQWSKRRTDTDYRQNQALAQRTWTEAHADYWRHYRLTHPEYCERNRLQQRNRDGRRRGLAKMDASEPIPPVSSGIYRLMPTRVSDLAKMDAWTVKITFLSKDYEQTGNAGRILQREDLIGATGPPR